MTVLSSSVVRLSILNVRKSKRFQKRVLNTIISRVHVFVSNVNKDRYDETLYTKEFKSVHKP